MPRKSKETGASTPVEAGGHEWGQAWNFAILKPSRFLLPGDLSSFPLIIAILQAPLGDLFKSGISSETANRLTVQMGSHLQISLISFRCPPRVREIFVFSPVSSWFTEYASQTSLSKIRMEKVEEEFRKLR